MKQLLLGMGLSFAFAGFANANDGVNINEVETQMSTLETMQSATYLKDMMSAERPKADCGRVAWRHTRPTQAQNKIAKETLTVAIAHIQSQVPALHDAMEVISQTTAKHPMSKVDLYYAVEGFNFIAGWMQAVGRDAQVDVINLLSMEQRKTFDRVLIHCLQQGN